MLTNWNTINTPIKRLKRINEDLKKEDWANKEDILKHVVSS